MEKKNQDWRDFPLEPDEIEMLESVEKGEWKSVENLEKRRKELKSFFADENKDKAKS